MAYRFPAPSAADAGAREWAQRSPLPVIPPGEAPASRTLLRIEVPAGAREHTDERVESLMGRRPEPRFAFIQENARFAAHLDV